MGLVIRDERSCVCVTVRGWGRRIICICVRTCKSRHGYGSVPDVPYATCHMPYDSDSDTYAVALLIREIEIWMTCQLRCVVHIMYTLYYVRGWDKMCLSDIGNPSLPSRICYPCWRSTRCRIPSGCRPFLLRSNIQKKNHRADHFVPLREYVHTYYQRIHGVAWFWGLVAGIQEPTMSLIRWSTATNTVREGSMKVWITEYVEEKEKNRGNIEYTTHAYQLNTRLDNWDDWRSKELEPCRYMHKYVHRLRYTWWWSIIEFQIRSSAGVWHFDSQHSMRISRLFNWWVIYESDRWSSRHMTWCRKRESKIHFVMHLYDSKYSRTYRGLRLHNRTT